jgi:hypothetical protein
MCIEEMAMSDDNWWSRRDTGDPNDPSSSAHFVPGIGRLFERPPQPAWEFQTGVAAQPWLVITAFVAVALLILWFVGDKLLVLGLLALLAVVVIVGIASWRVLGRNR